MTANVPAHPGTNAAGTHDAAKSTPSDQNGRRSYTNSRRLPHLKKSRRTYSRLKGLIFFLVSTYVFVVVFRFDMDKQSYDHNGTKIYYLSRFDVPGTDEIGRQNIPTAATIQKPNIQFCNDNKCDDQIKSLVEKNRLTINMAIKVIGDNCTCASDKSTITEKNAEITDFSACLLIKDNNILLPEWLAYHYTVLPLRRLIVGVDPLSYTDPTPILNMYQSIGLHITTWTNDSFWIDGDIDLKKKNYKITNQTTAEQMRIRYKYRQTVFIKSCLQQLHNEGRRWTALLDTDEYLAFNYYANNEGAPSWCKGNITCARIYKQTIENKTNKRTKLSQSASATVAEYIHKEHDTLFDETEKPCIIFSRYLFFSQDTDKDIQQGLDPGFNATLFHTLRYRYRTSLSKLQLGKAIVDTSRYKGQEIHSIHRPLDNDCTGNNGYVHNAAMPFRVHHYVGSWETFRQPGYDARGKSLFDRRNKGKKWFDETTPRFSSKENSTWVKQFAKLVGTKKALALTQSARTREELKMEQLFQKLGFGNQELDWERINDRNQ